MSSSPTTARIAVLVHFLANGIGMGVWASRLPSVKHELGLVDGQIAMVVLAGALAAMASLRLAGPAIERFGSLRATQVAGTFMMLSLLMPAAAGNLATLALGIVLIAAGSSFQDVGMNSQAVAIERHMGRPIMSSFHAAFSIGGIAGAGFGALTARADLSYRATFAVASAVLVVAVLVANRWLFDAPETARREKEEMQGSRGLPHRGALLALGAVGLASFVAEGSAMDWIAIYLRDNTGSSAAVAAVGFMVFNITMTVGRLFGDRLAARFGAMPLVRAGTALAGAGSAAGLFFGTTVTGIAGFAVMGLGLSIVVTQVFSAAGQLAPGRAPAALSLVSAISYLGFLAGPAAIGAVAHVADLRTALFVPAALVVVASLVASRLHVVGGAPMVGVATPEPVPPAAGPHL